MEIQQSCRLRFSFRSATIVLCLFNLVAAGLLLQGFLLARSASNLPNAVHLRYIQESEDLRRAMEPTELIKRVREIQQSNEVPKTVQQKDTKRTAAVGLSKRLKDFRSFSDAASQKALEEWRKRKMERARLRESGRNGTMNS